MEQAALAINTWADHTFPGRSPKASLLKLNMEEIPELLTHLKQRGPEGIGEELADCFILLLDLAVIWNVNLAKSIEHKMTLNNNRMWRKDNETGFYNHVAVAQTADFTGADAARGRVKGIIETGDRQEEVAKALDKGE
jgi:NTP pyrophosphatase (non-canonical NTP hydrolase)